MLSSFFFFKVNSFLKTSDSICHQINLTVSVCLLSVSFVSVVCRADGAACE